MLCNVGWRVPKTLRQGLPCLLLWKGKGGLLFVLQRDISPLSSHPTTVHSIPFSAPVVASTELCRRKTRTSSWSLAAAHSVVMQLRCCSFSLIWSSLYFLSCLQLQCCCTTQFLSSVTELKFLPTAVILSKASP